MIRSALLPYVSNWTSRIGDVVEVGDAGDAPLVHLEVLAGAGLDAEAYRGVDVRGCQRGFAGPVDVVNVGVVQVEGGGVGGCFDVGAQVASGGDGAVGDLGDIYPFGGGGGGSDVFSERFESERADAVSHDVVRVVEEFDDESAAGVADGAAGA